MSTHRPTRTNPSGIDPSELGLALRGGDADVPVMVEPFDDLDVDQVSSDAGVAQRGRRRWSEVD